jgi:hypothetical protein
MKDGFNTRFATSLNRALNDSGVNLGGAALAYVADQMSTMVVDEVGLIITDPTELKKAEKELTDKAAAKAAAAAAAAADAAAKAKAEADAAAYKQALQSVDAEAFAKAFAAVQKPVAASTPVSVPPVPVAPPPVAPVAPKV